MQKVQILAAVMLVALLGAVAVGQFYGDLPYGAPPRGGPFWVPGDGPPVDVSDFRGEIVVVPHKGSDGQQVISGLREPRVRHLGKRQYLVGQDIATRVAGRSTNVNVTVWIPLEDTSELFEYRSVEDARKVWDLGGQAEEALEDEPILPEPPEVEVVEERS